MNECEIPYRKEKVFNEFLSVVEISDKKCTKVKHYPLHDSLNGVIIVS